MIYLFYGPDDFFRTKALLELKAAIPPDVADLNITTIDGRKLRLEELQAACEAYPFLAERRLVIVSGALKHLRSAADRDALKSYIAKIPPTADVVFVETDDPDQRTALFKELKLHAEVRVFSPLAGEAAEKWLIGQARELGVTLLPAAARTLVESIGNDSWALWNELRKLATYVGEGGSISQPEIELLVSDTSEANLFAFIDLLFSRQRTAAAGRVLDRLHELLAGGDAPHYILFMIARQVRLMLSVQGAGRASPDQLARTLGQRPFVIRKALDQARGFTPAELRALHDQLVELDQAIKTGQLEPVPALDLLVGNLVLSR